MGLSEQMVFKLICFCAKYSLSRGYEQGDYTHRDLSSDVVELTSVRVHSVCSKDRSEVCPWSFLNVS